MIRIEAGDALQVIPRLASEGVVVDSVVTDPPYHLTARTKRFGDPDAAPPQYGNDGAMGRLSKGFMGKQWDGGDIAFRPETWKTIGTILRPGGFLFVFGGTRTYHRMTCAIEDAGFVIQDCIMWMYGTGFPKRRDMLKPAYEPIVVAYKPGGDRTMQIDECRISATGESFGNPEAYAARSRLKHRGWVRPHHGEEDDEQRAAEAIRKAETLGRWPANVCHDGSDEVVEMFPNSGSGSGQVHKAGPGRSQPLSPQRGWNSHSMTRDGARAPDGYGDSGSAARFFWSPKANKKDRNGSQHPTVKPISLLDWLVPLGTPVGGIVLDPFAGSGTTGSAAQNSGRDAILIERDPEYLGDIRRRFGGAEQARRDFTAALQLWMDPPL